MAGLPLTVRETFAVAQADIISEARGAPRLRRVRSGLTEFIAAVKLLGELHMSDTPKAQPS